MRIPNIVSLFVIAVVATFLVFIVAFASEIPFDHFGQLFLFAILITIASSWIITDPAGRVLSSTAALFYTIMYLFDPITVLLVAALGYSAGNTLPRGWVTWRAFFNGAQIGLSVAFGSLVYRLLGGEPSRLTSVSQVLPTLFGPLAYQVANNFFTQFFLTSVRRTPFLQAWLGGVRDFFLSNLLSVPTAVLITILYVRVHYSLSLIFLVSLPFQQWAVKLYLEKRDVYSRIVESLVRAGELGHPSARGHARRVADLSVRIARELGLIEREVETIEFAGLLHDIGMIAFDDVVLSGASADLRPMNAHVRLGAEIVSELSRQEITEMVLNHHVAFSESPLSEDKSVNPVSLGARIVALAEEVDSRLYGLFPHSETHSFESIRQMVVGRRGSEFDPRVVDAFLRVVDSEASTRVVSLGEQETPPAVIEGSSEA